MKKIYYILFVILISQGSISAQTDGKKVGIDIYPLPMLLGEFGAEINFVTSTKTAIGLQMIYYNPNIGLTGIIIRNKLGKNDKLEMDANAFMPGIAFTYFSKSELEGFYLGGLFRYKIANLSIFYHDYSASDPDEKLESALANGHVSSLNINLNAGYRWVFKNNFSLRLGLALGPQIVFTDDVAYRITYTSDGNDGEDAKNGLKSDVPTFTKSFTKPFTFQAVIGLGFTF